MTLHRSTLSLGLALAILATGGVVEAQESGRPKHDPLQGMEPSGRIPKVPLPADLRNPERWRYLPEGRIMPGNTAALPRVDLRRPAVLLRRSIESPRRLRLGLVARRVADGARRP
jgi:hypothetical protein